VDAMHLRNTLIFMVAVSWLLHAACDIRSLRVHRPLLQRPQSRVSAVPVPVGWWCMWLVALVVACCLWAGGRRPVRRLLAVGLSRAPLALSKSKLSARALALDGAWCVLVLAVLLGLGLAGAGAGWLAAGWLLGGAPGSSASLLVLLAPRPRSWCCLVLAAGWLGAGGTWCWC